MDYSRNWLFIPADLQVKLANLHILVAGLGIGSVFAEMALRTGIGRLILADGDTVAASNLNRQNYGDGDIGAGKAAACAARLRAIAPTAPLQVIPRYLQEKDLRAYIQEVDIVVNTIDFDAPEFSVVSNLCRQFNKLELFPINLGFGTALTLIDAGTMDWRDKFPLIAGVSLKEQILQHITQSSATAPYLQQAARTYFTTTGKPDYDPQLAISTSLAAALMVTTIVRHTAGEQLPRFPHFYYLDAASPVII